MRLRVNAFLDYQRKKYRTWLRVKIPAENTRKTTKNAVVTLLAYWNEVKAKDERVKNTESLEKISKKELNKLPANFRPNAKKQNGESYKKSALMGIRFGLQRHFLLKREFDI